MEGLQLVIGGLLVVAAVVATIAFLILYKRRASHDTPEPDQRVQAPPNRAARRANRLGEGLRRRRAAAAAVAAAEAQGQADDEAEGSEEEEGEEEEAAAGGRQRRRDLVRAARQAERDAFAARLDKKSAYEERRRAKEAEREEREREKEEAAARAAAEKQAREDAEAAKWMDQISLEQEGADADEHEQGEGLLAAFVDYIQTRKTVKLDELAAEFGLRIQDAIDRVQELESQGRISGVMDDRGKFIYISREEMEKVADFIRARGRVAISELANRSNDFIDLEARQVAHSAESVDLDLDLDELQDPHAAAAPKAVSVGA
eukprot:jgi/Botrbrau1/10599/Bobra.0358s0018.1